MNSRLFLFFLLFLFTAPLFATGTEDKLKESVTTFWQANESRDKVTSMKYVHPDDLNNFLNKKVAAIKNWELDTISFNADSSEAEVRIKYSMETYPGISFNLTMTETWQLVNDEWRVRVPDPSLAMKEALFASASSQKASGSNDGSVKIRPDNIKFYKTNTMQPAFIWIENGLDIPASLALLEVDQNLIEVAEKPEIVNPGEKARIKLLYIGSEKEKENLLTQVVLEIKSGEDTIKRTIPAVYNYMNSAMKWIQKQNQPGEIPQP